MSMGSRAKICREMLGLSQYKLSEKLGISQPSYQRFENGKVRYPSFIEELALIFNTTPKWLMFGASPMENIENENDIIESVGLTVIIKTKNHSLTLESDFVEQKELEEFQRKVIAAWLEIKDGINNEESMC